jgi:hypothetical protein
MKLLNGNNQFIVAITSHIGAVYKKMPALL